MAAALNPSEAGAACGDQACLVDRCGGAMAEIDRCLQERATADPACDRRLRRCLEPACP